MHTSTYLLDYVSGEKAFDKFTEIFNSDLVTEVIHSATENTNNIWNPGHSQALNQSMIMVSINNTNTYTKCLNLLCKVFPCWFYFYTY